MRRYKFPPRKERPVTNVLSDEEAVQTQIGKKVRERLMSHPGESGVHPLQNAHDAYAARALMAQTAEKTLDVQYYIWKNDLTGTLMLKKIMDAADRGVRVRLLLDDNGITGMDRDLAALNMNANIEVRIFNPFWPRKPKSLGLITDFRRLNRRMHNKAFIADNRAAIVGGRNIGDEYFGAGSGLMYADLDVLLIGAVVKDISEDFDRYWNSSPSLPIHHIIKKPRGKWHQQLHDKTTAIEKNPDASGYIDSIRDSNFIQDLFNENIRMEWANVHLVSDDPGKVLDKSKSDDLLTHQIQRIIGWPEHQLDLVSPYFVPTKAGVGLFTQMSENGIAVRILTNSLGATDVKVVHAGYEKRRRALLKAGVRLFELKRIIQDSNFQKIAGPFGSSGSSLHAKTFSVDRKKVFVGSINFDPRSFNLNTEMGILIESEVLADEIQQIFEDRVPNYAYEVQIDPNEKLTWHDRSGKETVVHRKEPETGLLMRIYIRILQKLPIEWLL